MSKKLFIILFSIHFLFFGSLIPFGNLFGNPSKNPWGKDADLVTKISSKKIESCCQTPFFGKIGESVIRFHQTTITPCDGPRSHFRPSSSQYMLDAMRKYGFFKGFSMGCDRLMRENNDPWVYRVTVNEQGSLMKFDPVP